MEQQPNQPVQSMTPQPSDNQTSTNQSASGTPPTKRRKLIAITAGIVVILILLSAIAILIVQLGNKNANDATKASNTQANAGNNKAASSGAASGSGNLSGSVSKLAGSVTSLRNLKGLTIRINQVDTCASDSISAYVSVSTDAGVVNTNFGKADVTVYLDGKKVSDFSFEAVGSKQPSNAVLAIDHSGSMKGTSMDNAKAAAISYVNGLQAGDQVAVVQFDNNIDVLSGLTSDKAATTNKISTIQARGNTSVYDALEKSVSLAPICGRKAVIALTDGEDTSSSSNVNAVIQGANKANLPIFTVGLQNGDLKPDILKSISDQTGGQYLGANTAAEIAGIYSNINGQIKGQFAANLKVGAAKNNQSHTLKIVSNVEGSPTSSERTFVF